MQYHGLTYSLKHLLLFALVVGAIEARALQLNDENRIIGGDPVEDEFYPFFVMIKTTKAIPGGLIESLCGGNLVARDVVLTVRRLDLSLFLMAKCGWCRRRRRMTRATAT